MSTLNSSQPTPERELELLSVVAPMLNEELTVRVFYRRVCEALKALPFELVVVDDGSTDGTCEILAELAAKDERLRVVFLSRNFGHQLAITAGLDHARGDAVVMIDSDLQDPPDVIPEMVNRWRHGCDVVYAVREQRLGESWFKLVTARWFYRIMAKLSRLEAQPNAGDFRLLDRSVVQALSSMRERSRFLRGMTSWVGFRQGEVVYKRDARFDGDSKYTLKKMIRFSIDAIVSFSQLPLQIATFAGIGCVLGGLTTALLALLHASGLKEIPDPGAVLSAVLFIGGIQLMAIGLIGEYVGRIYEEVKGRPLYLVRARRNFESLAEDSDESVMVRAR